MIEIRLCVYGIESGVEPHIRTILTDTKTGKTEQKIITYDDIESEVLSYELEDAITMWKFILPNNKISGEIHIGKEDAYFEDVFKENGITDVSVTYYHEGEKL
jgi:hypothetical protein